MAIYNYLDLYSRFVEYEILFQLFLLLFFIFFNGLSPSSGGCSKEKNIVVWVGIRLYMILDGNIQNFF